MRRVEFVIALGFIIMFVAGLTVGWTLSTPTPATGSLTRPVPSVNAGSGVPPTLSLPGSTTRPAEHFSTFSKHLALTDEQKKKADTFWSEATATREKSWQAVADDAKAREVDIRKLLSPELQEKYDEIQRRHDATVATLHAEIGNAMDEMHAKFLTILTPSQREKFDQMAKDPGARRGPPHWGPHADEPSHRNHPPRWHGPETGASAPATAPS